MFLHTPQALSMARACVRFSTEADLSDGVVAHLGQRELANLLHALRRQGFGV